VSDSVDAVAFVKKCFAPVESGGVALENVVATSREFVNLKG
jgi:hypothetical protein